MTHPTPTPNPILYDAGLDWKLLEANGWTPEGLRPHHARLFILQITDGWIVTDSREGECALSRPQVEGEPIAFYYRHQSREKCPTVDAALVLITDYLNQIVNPYMWLNEHSD